MAILYLAEPLAAIPQALKAIENARGCYLLALLQGRDTNLIYGLITGQKRLAVSWFEAPHGRPLAADQETLPSGLAKMLERTIVALYRTKSSLPLVSYDTGGNVSTP